MRAIQEPRQPRPSIGSCLRYSTIDPVHVAMLRVITAARFDVVVLVYLLFSSLISLSVRVQS